MIRRSDHARGVALLGALLVLALAGVAHSDDPAGAPAPDEAGPSGPAGDAAVAQARDAFRLGSTLARQGQWTEALAAFERSARLRAHPVTTYDIGFCERALGRYTLARRHFGQALEQGGGGELSSDLQRQAQAYLAEAERLLARVVVTLTPAGATLAVDSRPLEVESSSAGRPVLVAGTREPGPGEAPPGGTFDLLADPGPHVFVIAWRGTSHVVDRTLGPGSSTRLELTAPEPTAAPSRAPARRAPRSAGHATRRAWGWASLGVGAAGVAVGSIAGLAAVREKSKLDEHCAAPDACEPKYQGDIDSMNRSSLVSTIGFGVGVGGAGLGAYLLLAGGDERASGRQPGVRAFIGPGTLGATGSFR